MDQIFHISAYSLKRNLKIIFNSLNAHNPLALLFFPLSFFNDFGREVYEKFIDSLHVKYKFEEEFDKFHNQNFKFNVKISGRIICFKNILRILQNPQLRILFGLSNEGESEVEKDVECCGTDGAVYSVGMFLYSAKFVLYSQSKK